MARTPSNMIPLGTPAPSFRLTDVVSGTELSLEEQKGELATVIMFICNHCPFVKHINPELVRLARDYQEKGISFLAISSNDILAYPQDGPEEMKSHAASHGYPFPYLFDETQEVAKAYSAACTPDFYVFDANLLCVYRGQLDDSRPDNGKAVSGADLRRALDALLRAELPDEQQVPSLGCNIKWKPA